MKRIITRCCSPAVLVVCCGALALAACRGNSSGNDVAQKGVTLRAEVVGLNSSGLSLADPEMGLNVPVPSDATTVVLASSLSAGIQYNITVGAQPVDENCTVPDGSGTLGASSRNVDVTITCFPASSGFVLHSFAGGSDGAVPWAALVQGSDGDFYGTSSAGGSHNDGTVFKITPAGVETVLHSFAGGSDGAEPMTALIQASDGNFYGTTDLGGTNGDGTVFKITPAGDETVLYSFPGDYGDNLSGLIQASDGNFYGIRVHDGVSGCGTAFRITPAGLETVLYSFAGGNDGCNPQSGLMQASDGNFYGTTVLGGAGDGGTVFKITPAGVETVLHSFSGGSDGSSPVAGVIQANDGNFYGTTWSGGANNEGTVFELTRAGVETVLYSFTGVADGQGPTAGLIQAKDGNFYGIAPSCCADPFGSSSGWTQNSAYGTGGLLFTVNTMGAFAVLYSFNLNGSDGTEPGALPSSGGVIQAGNGEFYGTAAGGGAANEGTVFELNPLFEGSER